MKRLVLLALLGVFAAATAFGQNAAIDKALQDEIKKTKEKSDKDITNDKAKDKAKTWIDRAKAYEEVALRYASLDSSAALIAYDAYKKAVELDTKEGKQGKLAKEAQDILVGGGNNLYAALMQQGAAKYQAKNMKDALKLMQTASMVHAKDTTATLYTGIVAQQLDDQKLARESFERYLAGGGKGPEIFYAVANMYKAEKNFDQAVKVLDQGIAANPTNKDLQSEKINIFLSSGKADEAISNLKQMADADPKNVQTVLNLAILYDNQATNLGDELKKTNDQMKKGGQLTKRIADQKGKTDAYASEITRLQAAVKKQPKSVEMKRLLTDANKVQAENKATLDQLNQDLKTFESSQQGVSVEDLKKRTDEMTARQTEQRKQAQDYYNKALQIEPANYDANYNMGVFYFNEAVETKRRIDAMDMQAYQKEGKSVENQVVVKFKEAMPYFEKAYEVKQESEVKDNLKNLYTILKQYEKSDAYDAKLKKISE
ncbi:MAG: hypothetical protein LH606_21270 [Cytophagaceae bacterium]|nr:hypothetical protein [Cytophagaceae bacterium]